MSSYTGVVMLLPFAIMVGSPVVIMPQFELEALCRNIEKYKVTVLMIVPPVCLAMVHHPGMGRTLASDFLDLFLFPSAVNKYNLKTVRILLSGAHSISGLILCGITLNPYHFRCCTNRCSAH